MITNTQAGTISGTVTFQGGAVSGATVSFSAASAITDSAGRYSFTFSFFDSGTIRVQKTGYTFPNSSQSVTTSGNTTVNVDALSGPAPTLSALADVTGTEDTTSTVTLSGIGNGDAGLALPITSVTAVSDNTNYVNTKVTWSQGSSTASLSLTPAPDANSDYFSTPATILVTVTRQGGGTTTRTFGYAATPVNDLPMAGPAAMVFDGVDDQIYSDMSSQNLTVNGSFTVETWFRMDTTSGTNTIFASRDPSDYGFDFKIQDGIKIHGDIGDGSKWLTTAADGSGIFLAGVWHHLAYVVTPSGYNIYLDGIDAGKAQFPAGSNPLLLDSTHNIRIGSYGGGREFFRGALADFRIWNVARTAAQISAGRHAALPITTPGLIVNYRFGDAASSYLIDLAFASEPDQDGLSFGQYTSSGRPALLAGDSALAGAFPAIPAAEDNATLLTLPSADVDGPATTIVSATAAHGTLSRPALPPFPGFGILFSGFYRGFYNYIPTPGYSGADTITYVVGDSLATATNSVKVSVAPINYPPVAGQGTALAFDGVDDQVAITNNTAVSGTFTVEAWVRPEDPSATMAFMGS
ncbi:MAG TPA: LamG-like jellyroll fold domain-containing protein, partial [Verrucomicrobiae bacterium]